MFERISSQQEDIIRSYYEHSYISGMYYNKWYQIIVELGNGRIDVFDPNTWTSRSVDVYQYYGREEATQIEFSHNLRTAIKHSELSREEIAERAEVSVAMISRYCWRKSVPSIVVAKRLADILKCTLDDLLPDYSQFLR